jgi:hypothetical protein
MYAATPHGAARLPRMNTYARPADGVGAKIKSQIKSQIKSRIKSRIKSPSP